MNKVRSDTQLRKVCIYVIIQLKQIVSTYLAQKTVIVLKAVFSWAQLKRLRYV